MERRRDVASPAFDLKTIEEEENVTTIVMITLKLSTNVIKSVALFDLGCLITHL